MIKFTLKVIAVVSSVNSNYHAREIVHVLIPSKQGP
jgi:hypothetical protein